MSVERLSASDIANQNKFELSGDVVTDGLADRANVCLDDGRDGLLFVWDDEVLADRAAWLHSPERAQLFVVPELLLRGPHWCVLEGIDGVRVADILAEDPEWIETAQGMGIIRQLGQTLRKIHSGNAAEHFGDVLEDGETWMTFNGYVAAHLEVFAEKARTIGLDDDIVHGLLGAIGQARHELASFHPRGPSCLVHGMPSFDHVWVNEESTSLVGLTGFEHAALLPAELDIAWAMWIGGIAKDDLMIRALYRGYGAARTMDVQRRERFYRRFVGLLSLFGAVGRPPEDTGATLELIGA